METQTDNMVATVDLKKDLDNNQAKNEANFDELRGQLGHMQLQLDDLHNDMLTKIIVALEQLFANKETQEEMQGPKSLIIREAHHNHSYFSNHHLPFMDNSRWNRFPKIEVNKFSGPDPTRWASQMEHYFSLHKIMNDTAKLKVIVLHLDSKIWQC